MNKRHWITLEPGGWLDAELVRELVTESICSSSRSCPGRSVRWIQAPSVR